MNINIPQISVVLPVYNVANYINDTINSILNQTIQDFEIIVIDDCSTDKTLSIIESIKDSRIRIITKPKNKGLIDSLNTGFKEAKGQFIARVDGDDINALDRFEKQLKILQSNSEIKACGCWLQCFGASTKIIKHKEHHKEIQAQLLLGNPMSLGATMLNKNAYKNYKFDASKIHAEDYDFWATSAWDCKMYNIQEVLYHYRVHENQVSSQFNAIQKQQDIGIKLNLYHKINYDKNIYSDAFITKLLFSNKEINSNESKLFFEWLNILIDCNKSQGVFDDVELKKIIAILKIRFVMEVFFLNIRENIGYKKRKEILSVLPLKEKFFIIRKKLKEKIKL